jgi:hypothetical protein
MASPFDALDALTQVAVDAVYGEDFRFEPRARSGDVNAPDAPDAARAVVASVPGIYHAGAARGDSGPAHRVGVTAESPGVISTRPVLTVQASRLPWRPRTGDRVLRLATGQAFRIAEPKAGGNGARWTLDLNAEATP